MLYKASNWDPPQSTIHPFALLYYNHVLAAVDVITYVAMSDCLIHDAATFYCFHHEVMAEMKKLVEDFEKVSFHFLWYRRTIQRIQKLL